MPNSVLLEWRNLHLNIEKRKFHYWRCRQEYENKIILNNVSGSLKSGQLVAILGASGAGKTTLLAGISYRFRGPLKGQISINGSPVDRKTMTKMSCFVPQFDITLGCLTINEHMHFMSQLKLDRKWSRTKKMQRIDFLLREMGLKSVADNRISTLSGGERKKLNLVTDLLTNPPIIFCDEPTTGLDSYNAHTVIKALKYLTNIHPTIDSVDSSTDSVNGMELKRNTNKLNGMPPKAIICSIHQPTSVIFQCFSHIILMYSGHCLFQGTSEEALQHFSKLGFHCPISYNQADFYIELLSHKENEEKIFLDLDKKIIKLDKIFEVDDNREEFKIEIRHHNTIWIMQVWFLIQRSYVHSKRNSKNLFYAMLIYLVNFTTTGLLFSNVNGENQDSIQDVQGLFFMLTCEVVFSTFSRILNTYLANSPLIRRETHERTYTLSAYYVADMLSDVPFLTIRPLIGLIITYILAGINKGIILLIKLWITMIFVAFTSNAYGLMLVGLFRSLIMEIPPLFTLTFMAVSGAYASIRDFPLLKYTSLFFYANEAMSILFWTGITEIDCPEFYNGLCLRNGTEVLANISYNTEPYAVLWDFIGLVALGTLMHIVAFIGIRRYIHSAGYY